MRVPDTVPTAKRADLRALLEPLTELPGVVAIALGGSTARGRNGPGSDLDIGVYYSETEPFAIDDVQRVIDGVTSEPRPKTTDFYEWGPWVNGGAWIPMDSGRIDLLYRCIEHVERSIVEAKRGEFSLHFGQQPPYGFHSVVYLGETRICVPIHDPRGVLARLKRQIREYPPALRRELVASTLFSAEFTLATASRTAASGDVYGTVGCLTRAVAELVRALFAANEEFMLTDKGALEEASSLARAPSGFAAQAARVLSRPGSDPAELRASVHALDVLFRDVVAASAPDYEPKYALGVLNPEPVS